MFNDNLIRSFRGSERKNNHKQLFILEVRRCFSSKIPSIQFDKKNNMLSTNDIQLHSSYSSLITDDYCHDEVIYDAFIPVRI